MAVAGGAGRGDGLTVAVNPCKYLVMWHSVHYQVTDHTIGQVSSLIVFSRLKRMSNGVLNSWLHL